MPGPSRLLESQLYRGEVVGWCLGLHHWRSLLLGLALAGLVAVVGCQHP